MYEKMEFDQESIQWMIRQTMALTRFAAALGENMSGIEIILHPDDGLILSGTIRYPNGFVLPYGENMDDPMKTAQLEIQKS